MAATGLKRFLFSNTSYFSNFYLIECIKKCKSKSYLKFIMMIIGKDLSMTKKKLDYSQNENVQRGSSEKSES